jgi:glycosyltransferase involved in cell wall biosynthesis
MEREVPSTAPSLARESDRHSQDERLTRAGDAPAPTLIFVNRFFHPDHSATSQILSDVAFHMAGQGLRVSVVTAKLGYESQGSRSSDLPAREVVRGVEIIRVRTTRFGRAKLVGRAVDFLSFYLGAALAVLIKVRRGDVLIAKTDPPLLSVPIAWVAGMRGAALVNWLQDLYPEVALAAGVRVAGGPLGRVLTQLRDRSLMRARVNVVIGDRMAEQVAARGAPRASIRIISNFVDDAAITPRPAAASRARAEWGFGPDDFVVGYSGNLGRAHEVETLLSAAERLKDHARIKFLFVGGGHLAEGLAARAEARGLRNVVQKPYQPREALADTLAAADVHWVALRPEFEGLIVPSKVYAIAAAGRPIIAVGDEDGEIARLVRAWSCGRVVSVGDAERLAASLSELSQSPSVLAELGAASRAFIVETGGREAALAAWARLFDDVLVAPGPVSSHDAGATGRVRPAKEPPSPKASCRKADSGFRRNDATKQRAKAADTIPI